MNKPEDIIEQYRAVNTTQDYSSEANFIRERYYEFAKQTVFLAAKDLISRPANAWEYFFENIEDVPDVKGTGLIHPEYVELFDDQGTLIPTA